MDPAAAWGPAQGVLRHPCALAKRDGEHVRMAGMSVCDRVTVRSGSAGVHGVHGHLWECLSVCGRAVGQDSYP